MGIQKRKILFPSADCVLIGNRFGHVLPDFSEKEEETKFPNCAPPFPELDDISAMSVYKNTDGFYSSEEEKESKFPECAPPFPEYCSALEAGCNIPDRVRTEREEEEAKVSVCGAPFPEYRWYISAVENGNGFGSNNGCARHFSWMLTQESILFVLERTSYLPEFI